jgi:hypothetical protein
MTESKIVNTTETPKFEAWAILEIMGHVKLAGFVSEQTIAGSAFIRIDVPASGSVEGFTRFFGSSSVYSLSPVTEETARDVAGRMRSTPINEYDISEQLKEKWKRSVPALPGPPMEQSEDWDDEDTSDFSDGGY